jgi:hypothetical protein
MHSARLVIPVLLTVIGVTSQGVRGEDRVPPPFLRLEYRAVTTTQATREGVRRATPALPRSERTFVVVLGSRRVDVQEEGLRTVLDYGQERMLRVEADGRYRESSLLARIAYLDMEMKNRATLRKLLDAAGAKDEWTTPREISTLFGWPAEGDDTSVETELDGRAVVFRDCGEELARWTPSTESLDDEQRASLARFLQFGCRLHPAVRDAISAKGLVPEALRFRWFDVGMRSTTDLTLLGATRAKDAGATQLGRRIFDESDKLARLAQRVIAPTEEEAAARIGKDDFVRLAQEARAAGRFEDAALLLIECGLQTGDQMAHEFRELLSDEAARERTGRLLGIIGNRDPEACLAGLAALDRTAFGRPHVLDVFRANALSTADRPDEAIDAMIGALLGNPWLAGAWKDLGGIFYGRFDTDRAWLAWEAGRRAAPDHPMWVEVRRLEDRLRNAYGPLL